MAKAFTLEQDTWLRINHSPSKPIRMLTDEFNGYWGEDRNSGTMKHHCWKLGLQQESRKFTSEQNAWLREHVNNLLVKDATELFNQKFNTSRSEDVIRVHCNRDLGIRFLHDRSHGDPVGTETIRNGYIWVKVSDKKPEGNEQAGWINWRQKAHVVWEEHYGSMPPEGYTIVFLDGNHLNPSIENLYAVSGRVLREMSKKSWWSSDPNFTLAAIKWCELHYTIKDLNNKE